MMDIADLVKDLKGHEIRYLIYRRMFTPHEQSEKFEDESVFEDTYYTHAFIGEMYNLPDGDILLRMDGVDEGQENGIHEYVKLSEIRIWEFKYDQPGYEEDEDEED